MRSPYLSLSCAIALLGVAGPLSAQVQDAAPVDTSTLLKELHKLRDAQTVQSKQLRQTALQQVNSAAGSAERAVAFWEEAVRAVQFDGAPKEGAAFREWKEKDGEALAGPLARNAARLFFTWLSITIQRDGGMSVKDLLPQIMAYTRDLAADDQAAEALDDSIKKDKEQGPGNNNNKRPVPGQQRKASDEQVKKMHDQILRHALGGSPVVQWLKLADFIDPEKWEKQPGNFDNIYQQIIQPELRTEHDPKVLEYWDYKVKRDGDTAAKTKLAFEIDKYTNLRRPSLLWSRAEDMILIGQKNRGYTEMFNLIRTYPQHPEITTWIAALEAHLAPPPPPPAADGATSTDPTAVPGSATPPAPPAK